MHMKCKYCGSTQHEEKDCKIKKLNILVILSVLFVLMFCLQTSTKTYQNCTECCSFTTKIDKINF